MFPNGVTVITFPDTGRISPEGFPLVRWVGNYGNICHKVCSYLTMHSENSPNVKSKSIYCNSYARKWM